MKFILTMKNQKILPCLPKAIAILQTKKTLNNRMHVCCFDSLANVASLIRGFNPLCQLLNTVIVEIASGHNFFDIGCYYNSCFITWL